jgi:hypothetical protein
MRCDFVKAAIPIVAFVLLGTTASNAQSFTCSFGKRAACLDYGDQVCTSYAKCVDANAACFDQYQCNYEGFTCKSYVTECAENLESLADEYDDLARDYRKLRNLAEDLAAEVDNVKICLSYASNLAEAQDCQYQ